MLELALKAQLPIISVTTDDPVNLPDVLERLTKRKATIYHKATKLIGPYTYYTHDPELMNSEVYKAFAKAGNSLVAVNLPEPDLLVFEAGDLPTPPSMLEELLSEYLEEDDIPVVAQVLKGLSLKRCDQIVRLTIARVECLAPKEVRKTRAMLGETIQGLIPVEPNFEFYQFPDKLEEWINLNKPYFLDEDTPPQLVPRGIMLEGSPGVGKSMAAKAIAHVLGVPLYRLDIASTLNRYVGESEGRVARALQLLEREAPCVLLLDEMEKVFNQSTDEGVTTRIMAQLLWWLADHSSKVLTLMTTNDLSKIPPELYRTGRMDMVMRIPRMSLSEAKNFAQLVFKSVLPVKPTPGQIKALIDALRLTNQDDFSHAEVAEVVYTAIKTHKWQPPI